MAQPEKHLQCPHPLEQNGVLDVPLQIQLPANGLVEVTEDGPGAWVPVSLLLSLKEVPDFWLCPVLSQAVAF